MLSIKKEFVGSYLLATFYNVTYFYLFPSWKYNDFMNDKITKFAPLFEFTSSIFRICRL